MCKRASICLSLYNVGNSCTTKTEIIFIQFQLLIFPFFKFPFRSLIYNFFSFLLSLTELNSIP